MKNLIHQRLEVGDLVIELDPYNNHSVLSYLIGFTKKRVRIKTRYYTSKGRLINPKYLVKISEEDFMNYIKEDDKSYSDTSNQETFKEYKEFKKTIKKWIE